ncbi:MAG: NAD(P)/FAD-dependent oxidoreductase [Candidatus Cloacimonadales bacterium]
MQQNIRDTVIIGAGAAGLFCASRLAEQGREVTILEKNKQLGKKLLITGKGRCNITNYCEVRELIANTPVNGKFMTNAFYHFDAFQTIYWFNALGLQTKVERGNRVFPASDSARQVVDILQNTALKNGVKLEQQQVEKIKKVADKFAIACADGSSYLCKNLVLATGGKSYPTTGSSGDGYTFAADLGHHITKLVPSLVPIVAAKFSDNKTAVTDLQGLALKNCEIKIYDKTSKVVYQDFGELLFTHFGLSGPIILSASSHLRQLDQHLLRLDLKPALSAQKLDERILREIAAAPRKKVENVLKNLLPRKLIPVICALADLSPEKQMGQISKSERLNLGQIMKNLEIPLERFRSIKEAIITSGGVDVQEIDPQSMQSKLVKNLFIIGELLDVDAYTGGFNLQIAWSSAAVAADAIADIV